MSGRLGEVRDHRRQLHVALVELERASTVAVGQPAEWRDRLVDALERLGSALRDHVHRNESDGGLFDDVLNQAPRLAPLVRRLREEHEDLLDRTERLIGRCHGEIPDEDRIADLREEVLDLLRQGSRHRQRGADLLYEAYDVDVSVGD